MLNVIEFIKKNPDWEKKLSGRPYFLDIKREDDLILIQYNQIESDFSNEIVRECRGIIIEDKTWKVKRLAFTKFFNQQEGHAAKLDFDSIRFTEKVDGSLISVFWHNGYWRVCTSGTIDAFKASASPDYSFGTLFFEAVNNTENEVFKKDIFNNEDNFLNKNWCYTFELVSPFNRIVVPYKSIEIYHLSTRDMNTLQEFVTYLGGIKTPKVYNIKTIEDALKLAEALPFSEEGYVANDKHFNRVKIKSPAYVAAHHLANNGNVNSKNILTIIVKNEGEEFLGIFPEYTELYNKTEESYKAFLKKLSDLTNLYYFTWDNGRTVNRKKFAEWALTTEYPDLMFSLLDNKVKKAEDYLGWIIDKGKLYDYVKSYIKD